MKKLILFLSICLIFCSNIVSAQECNDFFLYRTPTVGYILDSQSTSGLCKSDSVYKYRFQMENNKEYKISFFASAVFNAKVDFKLYNSKGNIILDLQGDLDTTINKPVALREFYDGNNMIYPYFTVYPSTIEYYTLEIKTNKLAYKKAVYNDNGDKLIIDSYYNVIGCVTLYLQYKYIESTGFGK